MKVIIMAAGPTESITLFGFPKNSKPKCLFHVRGETILERQVRILKKLGVNINDIIVVGGYKIDMVKQLNEEKKLGLKIVYNPTASKDFRKVQGWIAGLDTVRIGIRGLDDDVLLVFGDALLTEGGVRRIINHPKRCISVYSHHGYQMYKIPKELLPKLRELHKVGAMHSLHEFCIANNGIEMKVKNQAMIYDVDYYAQTDEGKK